jgi:hypothetical protein
MDSFGGASERESDLPVGLVYRASTRSPHERSDMRAGRDLRTAANGYPRRSPMIGSLMQENEDRYRRLTLKTNCSNEAAEWPNT